MTSKNLFFKLIKQDFQRRIWCPILIFVGYFLILEVRLLMRLGKIADEYYTGYYADAADYVQRGFFGDDVSLHVIIVCFAAFLCALSGFSYLHSKTQLDAYHSLPVNRTQLFLAKYVSGFLWFVVPFVFHILVCMGICAGGDALTGAAFGNAVKMTGVSVLAFLLAYAVFIMAVCLTGNLIISMLGSVVLFCYSAVAAVLAQTMFSKFFDTYVSIEGHTVSERFWAFSPLSMLIKFFNEWTSGISAGYLWTIAAGAVVYTLIAYALYRKRASEAAGKSIAFPWAEPVLKTLLVVPTALFSGAFFSELAGEDYYDGPWYLFGIIFGYLIFALLFEIIFRLDIKSALSHKKQLLFNAACVAFLFIIFRYDALGYDSYVPGESELTSCAVSIKYLMETSPSIERQVGSITYYGTVGTDEYRMESVAIQDNPSVLALAKKAAEEGIRARDLSEDSSEDNNYRYILFGFNRKNGKSVYRQYLVDISDGETLALIADIFNDEGYKEGTNLLLSEGWKQEYDMLYCMGTFTRSLLDITPDLQTKLLETYREEYLQLDFSTVPDTYPVGGVTLLTQEMYDTSQSWGSDYVLRRNLSLIYPQFTKTIALLKENGFDVYETIDFDDIWYISVEYYKETTEEDGSSYRTSVDLGKIYDREYQQQILDSVYTTEYDSQLSSYADFFDGDFGVYVYTYSSKGGKEAMNDYRFKTGMVPTFLYETEEYIEAVME